jgi:3'-phosphoadenosine 5'-phosphosulfate sulfotransferase (PAPS reductase)/FAD synthetase
MRDPFLIDGPTCISFSGGRTSAYMLWRVLQSNDGLPEDTHVLFANTGKEEEATLEFVRDCGKRWGVYITWLEYRNYGDMTGHGAKWVECDFDSAARNGEPFEMAIGSRGGALPNRMMRYCSSELKTRTMHRFLRHRGWDYWDTFLGIRADEPRRVAKFRANCHPETKDETVHMPLALTNIGAQDVARFWTQAGFDLGLPNMNGKAMHGNCDLCFLKPPAQRLSLIREKPSRAIWWVEQEKKARAHANVGESGCVFRQDIPTYAEMLRFVEQQDDFIGHQDEESIACFCGD